MPTLDPIALVGNAVAQAMLPDEPLHLDVWAPQNVVIPKGNAFPGLYSLDKTPMARRILQALSPTHPAKRVVARVASQMLKTQTFICAALGYIALAPCNILALEPNTTVTQRLSNRMQAAIEACPATANKVAKARARDAKNTNEDKQYPGGHLYMYTAGSDANLAEVPIRLLFCDEINRDGWVVGAKEGNRVNMAMARLTSYGDSSKAYLVSSPTNEGASAITDWYETGTQEHYHVPCPHCGHLHELVIENFRFSVAGQAIADAWMVCPECGCEIHEHHKAVMLPDVEMGGQARWVQTSEGDGETVSVTLGAFYAPLGSISWRTLAGELRQAREGLEKGDHEPMQVFVNTRLGLDYDRSDISSSTKDLITRAMAEAFPPRVVPDRALVLTAFADTQPNRLEVTIEAWGPGLEHWTVDHRILWGSPTDPPQTPGSVWQRLDELRRTPYAHASGCLLRISAYGIDSGGANTQDVYNYGGQRAALSCVITKGSSLPNRPIIATKPTAQDVDWQGQRRPEGVKLWTLGTDTAKDWLNNRMRLVGGPGAAHWCQGLPEDFYEQLLAERPVNRRKAGKTVRVWEKVSAGARNEALDCAVGNLALAHYLELHKWSAQDWAQLRTNLITATPDLFGAIEAAQAPIEPELPPAAHLQPPNQDSAPQIVAGLPPPKPPEPQPMPQQVPPAWQTAAAAAPRGRRVLSGGVR